MSEETKDFGGGYLLWILATVMAVGNLFSWWSIPWIWVFSPIWIPYAFVFGMFAFLLCIMFVILIVGFCAMLVEIIRENM